MCVGRAAAIEIRTASLADAESISALIVPLACRYIVHEFSDEGASRLLTSMTTDAVRDCMTKGFRYHVAERAGDIIGVVGIRNNTHVYHLFVAEEHPGQGIGRALWRVAQGVCRDNGNPGEFTVNSSLFFQRVSMSDRDSSRGNRPLRMASLPWLCVGASSRSSRALTAAVE